MTEGVTTYTHTHCSTGCSYDELIRKIQDHVDGSHFGVSEALTGQVGPSSDTTAGSVHLSHELSF